MFTAQESASKATKRPKRNPKYGTKSCTVDIRKEDFLAVYKNHRVKREMEIQESRKDPEKYQCEMCARNYKWKSNLSAHKKYECAVTPQFKC